MVTESARTAILVLGFGNPLMGDDGAGAEAVRLLSAQELPSHVKLEEAGVPGWGLPNLLDGWSSVILVDAVQMGQAPGAWRRFLPEEVKLVARGDMLSLHDPGLTEGLALAQALKLLPEKVVLYGIEPAVVNLSDGLSPEVRSALPEMVHSILNEILEGKP